MGLCLVLDTFLEIISRIAFEAMSDETSLKTKTELSFDKDGLKVARETEVKGFVSIIRDAKRYVLPKSYRDGELKVAAAETIQRKLLNNEPLNAAEKMLYLAANEGALKKAERLVQIVEKASLIEPKVAQIFNAEPSEVPLLLGSGVAKEEVTGRQYFWDRFRADAEAISDEYMQQLFARILAGEVSKPGSFSLRTLDALRHIDEETANLFLSLSKYAVIAEEGKIGGFPKIDEVPYSDLLVLAEADLVFQNDGTWSQYRTDAWMSHGGLSMRFRSNMAKPILRPITRVGCELLRFAAPSPPEPKVLTYFQVFGGVEVADGPDGHFRPWP